MVGWRGNRKQGRGKGKQHRHNLGDQANVDYMESRCNLISFLNMPEDEAFLIFPGKQFHNNGII